MSMLFNSREVYDLLGIKKSKIQYYVDCGLIIPSVNSSGPGTKRLFSERNIKEIKVVSALVKMKLGVPAARDVMCSLREGELSGTVTVYFTGDNVSIVRGRSWLACDSAVMVNLDNIVNR